MKSVSTLVEDIYALVDGGGVAPSITDLSQYLLSMAQSYSSLIVPENKVRTPGTLYFSEIGTPCKRKLWYKIHATGKEALQAHTRIKFGYGHMLEAFVLQLAKDAGHTVEGEQHRVEYFHPTGWRVSGRIDAIIDGVVVDVKSVSKLGKRKFEDGLIDDPFGYKDQLNGYATVLKSTDSGFLTIEKELGHINYYPMGEHNSSAWSLTVDQAVSAVSSPHPPHQGYSDEPQSKTSSNRKLGVSCSYCEYKQECWQTSNGGNGLRGFIYSNKVEWLTQVVDIPRVPEITYEELETGDAET